MKRRKPKMKKFWNWTKNNETDKRTLHLYGAIAEESWFDDEVTPSAFREELVQGRGDIEVWINSLGGDSIAAASTYNMLMEYKGYVTVKRTLHLHGAIAEESRFDDEVTPSAFREELVQGKGDIEVWINSTVGDCIAAAQIYNMFMEYPGDVTVKINGIAASAASVIAMAGTEIQMSPTSLMMIHNPFTVAIGDSEELKKTVHMIGEVNESIIKR